MSLCHQSLCYSQPAKYNPLHGRAVFYLEEQIKSGIKWLGHCDEEDISDLWELEDMYEEAGFHEEALRVQRWREDCEAEYLSGCD